MRDKPAGSRGVRSAAFLVFGLALAARIATSALQLTHGLHPITWFPTLAMWNDFYVIYGHQLSLLANGLFPYKDFAYSYPPLFLLILFPPFIVGGVAAASVPIIFFDALSTSLIYVMVSSRSGSRFALFASLAYGFSPLALFFVGFLWIGSQPLTFFILLSIYYLRREKPVQSSISLGLAVLFQQEALFILPLQLGWQVLRYGRKAWKGALSFLIIVLSVSAPFLAIAGHQYITDISYGTLAAWNPAGGGQSLLNGLNSQQSTVSPLSSLGLCSSATQSLDSFFSCVEYPNPLLTLWVNSVTWISGTVVIPLLLLLVPALYASRGDRSIAEILAGYSLVASITLFSFLVHPALPYYFIPVYALLTCGCRSRRSLLFIILFSTLSLTVSEGPFLEVLSLGAILMILSSGQGDPRPDASPGPERTTD